MNCLKLKEEFSVITKYLGELDVKFNNDNKELVNGLWATVINFDPKYKINILKLIKFLESKNIYARYFFSPLTSQKAYRKFVSKKI